MLFSTFPGLIYDLINKHLPLSTAALKGHMVQNRRGIRATSSDVQQVIDARKCVSDMSPAKQICSAEEDEIYCIAVIGNRNENTIYSDLTGRFPVQSYEGMQYIFVAYVYKINTILMHPMKLRADPAMVTAFTSIYNKLAATSHQPKHHVLDNECSGAVQQFLEKKGVTRKNVDANNYKVDATEPTVKTAKYRVIATMATFDASCSIQLWSKMTP